MKLVELWTPAQSVVATNKKTDKLRNIVRTRGPAKKKRIRDVALNKSKVWIPDPDPMDYLKGHADNGPKIT